MVIRPPVPNSRLTIRWPDGAPGKQRPIGLRQAGPVVQAGQKTNCLTSDEVTYIKANARDTCLRRLAWIIR